MLHRSRRGLLMTFVLSTALLLALAALGAGILVLSNGWTSIGGGLPLCLCIALAASCALGDGFRTPAPDPESHRDGTDTRRLPGSESSGRRPGLAPGTPVSGRFRHLLG